MTSCSVLLGVAAMFAAACAPSGDSSTFHEQQPDSGPDDTLPPGSLGSSDAGADSADASCAPAMLATYSPVWTPPKVTAGACTDQEIADAYDACFAPPVDPAKCTAYKTAHASCATCVSSDATDATHGPLVWQRGTLYFTVNVSGCLALEQGNKAPDSCAAAFDAAVECKRTSCDSCGATGTLDFKSLSTCESAAGKSGVCQTLGTKEGSTCGDLLAPDAATAKCFESSGETTRDLYLRIAPLFCK